MKRNLVVVRAGETSLHPQWIRGDQERNFDIFVSYYGEAGNPYSEHATYYEAIAGLKWPAIAKLLAQQTQLLFAYEACWFPDDDLLTDSATINRMFALLYERDLWLAQPALGPGSYATYRITKAVPGVRLRYTNFVEIMCPLFSRSGLSALGHTFGESISGWGLDFVWPHLLDYPRNRIAILDEVPVVHTRPRRGGTFYKSCSRMGVRPRMEVWNVLKKYGLYEIPKREIYGTINLHGWHL